MRPNLPQPNTVVSILLLFYASSTTVVCDKEEDCTILLVAFTSVTVFSLSVFTSVIVLSPFFKRCIMSLIPDWPE